MAEAQEGFTLGLDGLRTMHPDQRSTRAAENAIPMLNLVALIVRDEVGGEASRMASELLEEAKRWIRASQAAEDTGKAVDLAEAPLPRSVEFASVVENLVGYSILSPEQHVGYRAACRLRKQLEAEAAL
ncbi:MAG: hypothetical protein H6748_15080 [Spirochaetaceae bacterium]|nr:hypothetical protein [Spirochaetaceae bacterium]